jgi:hypothetical protein
VKKRRGNTNKKYKRTLKKNINKENKENKIQNKTLPP